MDGSPEGQKGKEDNDRGKCSKDGAKEAVESGRGKGSLHYCIYGYCGPGLVFDVTLTPGVASEGVAHLSIATVPLTHLSVGRRPLPHPCPVSEDLSGKNSMMMKNEFQARLVAL